MRIVEIAAPFVIPPALAGNYKVEGDFSNIPQWKAKVIMANSGGEKNTWDEVGYVMISLVDNTIIPIARSDEHNTGYDLLYRYSRRLKKIVPENYRPLFFGSGNYVYKSSDIPQLQEAVRRWLHYGGPDQFIKGVYDINFVTTFSHFANATLEELTTPHKDRLAPLGDKTFKALDMLGKAIRNVRSSKQAWRQARALLKLLHPAWYYLAQSKHAKLVRTIMAEMDEREARDDLKWLEEVFFSFDGIKNAMHNQIRAVNKDERDISSRDLRGYWGDLEMAERMLGDL